MLRQRPLPRPDRQLCCVTQRPSVELCAVRNVSEACALVPAPYYSMPPVLAGHTMQRQGTELLQLAESCRARVMFLDVVQPYIILPYITIPYPTPTLPCMSVSRDMRPRLAPILSYPTLPCMSVSGDMQPQLARKAGTRTSKRARLRAQPLVHPRQHSRRHARPTAAAGSHRSCFRVSQACCTLPACSPLPPSARQLPRAGRTSWPADTPLCGPPRRQRVRKPSPLTQPCSRAC